MFLKHSNFFKDRNHNNTLTIIGEGIDFSGEVNTEGNIHVDGTMRGTIKAQEVVIGPEGDFDGEITADILIINGNIKGKFNIKNLQVRKNGVLQACQEGAQPPRQRDRQSALRVPCLQGVSY